MGPVAGYVQGIIKHFGNYSGVLAEWGPGHDADMLIAGVDGVPLAAQGAQMAIYCILALPLIMGNDVRSVPPESAAILLNRDAIAISQDPLMRPGLLLGGAAAASDPTQVWFRPLASGEVAVALYNQGPAPAHPWHTSCEAFNETQGGYFSPSGASPEGWCLTGFGQGNLDWYCCNTDDCAGYNFSTVTGAGCLFKNVDGPFVSASGVNGYVKPAFSPPRGQPADITVNFADVGLGLAVGSEVSVYDVWAQKSLGTTNGTSWTGRGVPWMGTHFLKLAQVSAGGVANGDGGEKA